MKNKFYFADQKLSYILLYKSRKFGMFLIGRLRQPIRSRFMIKYMLKMDLFSVPIFFWAGRGYNPEKIYLHVAFI